MHAQWLQSCETLSPPGYSPWDSPGKNTGVGFHFLLQGIFPTRGLNPTSLVSPALAGGFFTAAPPGKPTYPSVNLATHMIVIFIVATSVIVVVIVMADHLRVNYRHHDILILNTSACTS